MRLLSGDKKNIAVNLFSKLGWELGLYVTVCVCVDGIILRAGGWSLKFSLLEPVTDKLGQTRPKAG